MVQRDKYRGKNPLLQCQFPESFSILKNHGKIYHSNIKVGATIINIIKYLLLPASIAIYMIYPLLTGEYFYFNTEYDLYKSFLVNFIETLKHGELLVWNEYVGGGHPAMYFGHYPITQNTLVYMLFGINDFTYHSMRVVNLVILLASFICAGRILKFDYLTSLIGALFYFSINFVSRIIIADTIGNLVLVYPLLIVLLFQIIKDRQWKTILLFNLVYIFWLTGGHIVYVYPHLIVLSIIYWIGVFVIDLEPFKLRSLKKFSILYFILFVVPITAVLYQYYFVYDIIKASNRLKEGLIVSPFEPIVWKQLWRSFQSSSYFWMGLFLTTVYFVRKYAHKSKIIPIILIGAATSIVIANIKAALIFADYIQLLKSSDFIIALLLYIILSKFVFKSRFHSFSQTNFSDFVIFTIYISLLSYYFYLPENISGYDYDLFKELSAPTRVVFIFCVLFSTENYPKNKEVKILILSLFILYLIRSHLTIPLMRFTGIVWYSVRDGSIFSPLFAFLFMFGLKNIATHFSATILKNKSLKYDNVIVAKLIGLVVLLVFTILLIQDSYNKFYRGQSHKYVSPNRQQLAVTPQEVGALEAHKSVAPLNELLLDLNNKTNYFYRIFEPEGNRHHLSGYLQDHKIYDAAIYESSISRNYKDFFEYTILNKMPPDSKEMKNILPHFVFAKHIHTGFNTSATDIPYNDVYLFFSTDTPYLRNQNIEFFWDIMQVKYLVVGSAFSKALEGFSDKENYKLLGSYPNLDLNVYEITKNKKYSRLGILPVDSEQDFNEVMGKINSGDVDVLRQVYKRIIYLDEDAKGFTLLKSQTDGSRRYYEIDAKQKGILIEFESWNRHWELKANGEDKGIYKVFHILRGAKIEPGKNQVELNYSIPYFKAQFIVSILAILTYVVFFVYIANGKTKVKL